MRRRLLSLFVILFFAVPVGISLSGCGGSKSGSTGAFCNGTIGPRVGDAQAITLQPTVGGISLGYSQTSSVSSPSATDCQGNAVSIAKYTYASSNANIADVNPTTGGICAGQWNRNNASGIPDYTFCTGNNASGVAELTASGGGANSNKVLIYVHPQITSISLGNASTCSLNADGTLADAATNCLCGNTFNGKVLTAPNCYSGSLATTATPLSSNSCLSFNRSGQLVARFYAGDPSLPASNITLAAGHATFSADTANIVTFENTTGVATALSPGTTQVTASIANSTSTVGLISVCPPKTITIATPNTVNGSVTVNPNNTEPITATVVDTNGVTLTGLNLTITSTTPVAIPATATGITPVFPGTAAINAFCLPPSCNPSPYNNVGLFGTGKPVSSNTLQSVTPGSNSTKLWIGSTDSLYLVPVDLTTGVVPSPTKLPFTPNSMVLSQNGATIFLGSSFGMMTFTTGTNAVSAADTTLQGKVLAVSPDSATVVVTDPTRNQITLYNTSSSSILSTFTGIGTRAAFTPDGGTVYVTTANNHLLVYSSFISWQDYDLSLTGANDVAVAVPSVGAFIGGNTGINGRSYCPNSTVPPTVFFPQASTTIVPAAVNDRVATTNDGRHLLDVRLAASGGTPAITDVTFPVSTANDGANGTRTFNNILPSGDCPESGLPPAFGTAFNTTVLMGVTTTGVTGVYPSSDSTVAFTTYLPATGAATTGAILPAYTPAATGVGTVRSVTLAAGATAPVVGVFSSDNKTFFTGTAGDNQVHLITRSTLTDTSQIAPKLPSNSGGIAVPNLLVQYPRTITNN